MSSKFQSTSCSSQSKCSILEALTCDICPHRCNLGFGQIGLCQVIKNTGGKIENIYEGNCSNIALEPIEKRPFFHFLPGSTFLSIGFYGCSYKCKFCLNNRVSQTIGESKYYSPQELVSLAQDKKAAGLAFTYNEPTIYHNYIEEVGNEIVRQGLSLKLVLKTSGFASLYVIKKLCLYADGINVDIKGDNEDYKSICEGTSLYPILKSIQCIYKMGNHIEISYLVLPSKINSSFNIYIRDWIAELDSSVPVHLLYFYPFYNMNNELSYKPSELIKVLKIFREKLDYVYVSNHFASDLVQYRNTLCSSCHKVMIDRQRKSLLISARCCNKSLYGTF